MNDKILFIGGPWDKTRKSKPRRHDLFYDLEGTPYFRITAPPQRSRQQRMKRLQRMAHMPPGSGYLHDEFKNYTYTERIVLAGSTEIRFWALKDIETDEALKRIFGDVVVHSGPVHNQPTPIK